MLGRKPVAYLTCNGSPPVGDTPSLMTFREVCVFSFSLSIYWACDSVVVTMSLYFIIIYTMLT